MRPLSTNKKATFDYEIIDTLEAGIVLRGHEVKSIKTQGCSLQDAIVTITDGEARLINMNIPLYAKASPVVTSTYAPKGRRKLLLTYQQLTKLRSKLQKSGLVLIPTKLRENNQHRIKLTIALAKRKKKIQKKQALKEKDTQRMMNQEMKAYKK